MPEPSIHRFCFLIVRSGHWSRRATLLAGVGLLALGCSQAKPKGSVAGSLRYRGAAVTEGIVSLYSPQLGFGNEVAVASDGTFVVEGLPHGPYQIAIHPPLLTNDYGGKAMPSLEPKRVDNIPEKYQNPSTSGFACDVSGRRVSIELDME